MMEPVGQHHHPHPPIIVIMYMCMTRQLWYFYLDISRLSFIKDNCPDYVTYDQIKVTLSILKYEYAVDSGAPLGADGGAGPSLLRYSFVPTIKTILCKQHEGYKANVFSANVFSVLFCSMKSSDKKEMPKKAQPKPSSSKRPLPVWLSANAAPNKNNRSTVKKKKSVF